MLRRKVGLLPASGSASRLNGIPKFALPCRNGITFLQHHIELMLEAVDEIRICSRAAWVPLLHEMGVQKFASIETLEPSSMNDALFVLSTPDIRNTQVDYIVGMPDTVLVGAVTNPYVELSSRTGGVFLAATKFREELRGKVGQLKISSENLVEEIRDKDSNCNHDSIWSAFSMTGYQLTRSDNSPSHSFQKMLDSRKLLEAVRCDGSYYDLGTLEGVREYYSLPNEIFNLQSGLN